MRFHSVGFFLFLGVVLALWRWLPWRWGRLVLVAASYVFYGAAEPWYCLLLAGSTLVDFVVALRLAESERPAVRRAWLGVSLGLNLGALCLFKYADFALENLHALFGGAGAPPALGWLLPVGISFYTFQTLSYTIDVYRRHQQPTRDLLGFALYVSFFPQLVAGPIERAGRLLPQLLRKGRPSRQDVELGFQRILWGLTKKLVFADRLGLMVQDVYWAPGEHDSLVLLAAIYAFFFQIYLDFSAYTDIAIGSARMIGVRLVENFDWPLLARNPSDIWRRWHISLANWFRDYVFQPLGGTKRSQPVATMLRLAATLVLMGLWHGASWNFVAFGVSAAAGLVFYTSLRLIFASRGRRGGGLLGRAWWSVPLAILLHQPCIMLEMVFFGTPDMARALAVLGGLFSTDWRWNPVFSVQGWMLLLLIAVHVWRGTRREGRIEWDLAPPLRAALWVALLAAVAYGTPEQAQPFIYFRF